MTGQMPTDPDDDAKPPPEGIEAQTRRVMDNLVLVLGELGLGLEHVTSTRAFLTDFERDYAGLNEVYASYFPADRLPVIAAAALSGQGDTPSAPDVSEAPSKADAATWTRLFVTAGRRDDLGPGEILGAVLRAADLQRTDVGRIEVRENFALVEVRPQVAEHTIRCLSGEKIRGRRVTARLDRHESSERGRSRRPDR